MRAMQRLDVFPKFDRKFEKDARQRTALGGLLSIAALVVMAFLVVSETRFFLSVSEDHTMLVDTEVGGDMDIVVNLTFHRVPCDLITVDAVDAFGVYAEGVGERATKTRVEADTLAPISAARRIVNEEKTMTQAIDPNGAVKENCPSCYGAEQNAGDCCHTCDDVRMAYQRKGWRFNVDDISVEQCAEERVRMATLSASKEGCNIHAKIAVSRVTGNLHFIPGRMYSSLGRRVLDQMSDSVKRLNLSHVVHTLEFGERFPGQVNPLDNTQQIHGAKGRPGEKKNVNGRFSYFVKVVPTRFQTYSLVGVLRSTVDSNQYSVTHHFTPSAGAVGEAEQPPAEGQRVVPGVFFTYDLSPIRVLVSRAHPYPSVIHFLLQLCAVCGGVLTVAGLTDALAYYGVRRLKKMREGKQI